MAELPSQLSTALADRYRLERELGRGGMATVYLAYDLRHGRRVALKVLHPDLAYALGTDRFLREIEVAARLAHPNILPLHDSGEAGGSLFYVMPFVEGESLRDRLNREAQLPVDDTVRIAREVADALGHAHGQGVIHRDIKPENILLSGGHAVVADFGIARAVGQDGANRLTETGMAVGTAPYMSPEQATASRRLDGRSDVYSLACVVYEMLAGEPPYTGPNAHAIMVRAMTEPPRPIHTIRQGVSSAVDLVLGKALAASAADRYAGAAEFAAALQSAIQTSGPAPRSRLRGAGRPLAVTLAVGLLLVLGALFAWQQTRLGGRGSDEKLVAVLPFENVGAAEHEDLSDGIADEVRGRLSTVPGVVVIARASSMSYKDTDKTPQQIARELGVAYLLTGTVRREKTAAGTGRIYVSPELMDVTGEGAPRIRWHQPFEASLTDVFQVYADIGDRVAHALGVALGDSARRLLAEKPTQDTAAYEAYLKGEALSQRLAASDRVVLRKAASHYARAVALDSTFVQAWAQLSRTHSLLFAGVQTTEQRAMARDAAERALALAPQRAEGHFAMGHYYAGVAREFRRAAEELAEAHKLAPNDAEILTWLAYAEQSLQAWETALLHQQQAQRLDPRSIVTAAGTTWLLLYLRRYPEAHEAADRALALLPGDPQMLEQKAMVYLAQGDLAGARRVIQTAPDPLDRELVAYLATYWDLYWLLDESQQQVLLRLTPDAFDGNRAFWALCLAETYALRGNRAEARAYADTARREMERQLEDAPEEAQLHSLRGLMLAYLGRASEAEAAGLRGVALMPVAKDGTAGPYFQHVLVRIHIALGQPEKALDRLGPLLKIPYYLSPGWLRVDPEFRPLRDIPRFQRLSAE